MVIESEPNVGIKELVSDVDTNQVRSDKSWLLSVSLKHFVFKIVKERASFEVTPMGKMSLILGIRNW